jgi:RNA polymerase sigma-70 factor (ECF subfamily)
MSVDPFVELYRTHGRLIYARCRRLLGEGAAAEDVTQETFVRLYRQLGKLGVRDGEETLRWIYRVATNGCLSELRKRRLRAEGHATPPEMASQCLEEVLADRDRALRVIAGVPEKLAAVALLHHVDGLDQGEVATVLGISRRTVVYRLGAFAARARSILGGA